MSNKQGKLRNLVFIFGLGTSIGYYALLCVTIVLAFFNQAKMTIIWTNIFGEAGIEFVLSIISIPCVIFTAKQSVDLYKKNEKGCLLDG